MPTREDAAMPLRPAGWGQPPVAQQQWPTPGGIEVRGAASVWDFGLGALAFLKKYTLVDIILATLLIGYFGWIDPMRRKDEADERKAIVLENAKTIETASIKLNEAVNTIVLDSQAARIEHGRQLETLSKSQTSDRERYVQTLEKMLKVTAQQGDP